MSFEEQINEALDSYGSEYQERAVYWGGNYQPGTSDSDPYFDLPNAGEEDERDWRKPVSPVTVNAATLAPTNGDKPEAVKETEMTEALAVRELRTETEQFMPVMSIEIATTRYKTIVEYVNKLLVEGSDYGAIPGAGTKKVLLKPGAEKLCTLFGLTKKIIYVEKIEDWNGSEHGGEPFFYYLYRYGLFRGDYLIADADGSCNSMEAKYRWRKGERACPGCGVEGSIIKGKAEYGGGWLCWTRKGGCGAKFNDTDERITSQVVDRVPNPDIADQVNTIQKMAQKRALIAATLLAVNASDFFTQDLEDFIDVTPPNGDHEPETKKAAPKPQTAEEAERGELIKAITRSADLVRKLDKSFLLWSYVNETYAVQEGLGELSLEQLRELVQTMSRKLETTKAPKK